MEWTYKMTAVAFAVVSVEVRSDTRIANFETSDGLDSEREGDEGTKVKFHFDLL